MGEERKRERKKERKRCPRCGLPYSYVEARRVGDNTYYYAVHVQYLPHGRRRVRRCYLGPNAYVYVTKLHVREGLFLKGLIDEKRAVEYVKELATRLPDMDIDPRDAEELADILERAAKELREKAKEMREETGFA